jgi:hypothetical protein
MPIVKDIRKLLNDKMNKLQNPSLRCLEADANRYSLLLLQPKGEIEYSNTFVRNKDRAAAEVMYRKYIELAGSTACDLVVTPEYSCPWSIIEDVANNDRLPAEGKLWVLGCESITPAELNDLRERIKLQCRLIYDDHFEFSAGELFLDPVCFLFRTKEASTNTTVNVAVVQFKTSGMGDGADRYESNNLIKGTRFYKFKNSSANSISLVTLICSDSLEYGHGQCLRTEFQQDEPALILHVQLNEKPRNDRYADYRKGCLQYNDQKDIICLNWAQDVKLYDSTGRKPVVEWKNASASAIYSKKWVSVISNEGVINSNEKKGLYLTHWETTRSFVSFLNFDPHVSHLALTKVSQVNSDPAMRSPALPDVRAIYVWDRTSATFRVIETVDGGAASSFREFDITPESLGDAMNVPLTLERLLLFSCGEVRERKDKWPIIQSMASICLGSEESIHRLTFAQDNCLDATEFRRRLLLMFNRFSDIRLRAERFPKRMERFANNRLFYDTNTAYSNLADGSGELATALYVGDQANDIILNELHAWLDNRLRELKKKDRNLPLDPNNILIWYVRMISGVMTIEGFPKDDPQDITDGGQESVVSYTRTK